MELHGKKARMNITIQPEFLSILKKAAKKNHRSMSKIIEYLIKTHVSDQRKYLEMKKRQLAKEMNRIDEEIELIDLTK